MGDREKMINGMCMTYRHDYGLMSPEDRQFIYRLIEQMVYHDVDPAIRAAFRAGQEAMRQKGADLLNMKPSTIRLMAGEMTAQEMRAVQAFLKNRVYAIAALPVEEMEK